MYTQYVCGCCCRD